MKKITREQIDEAIANVANSKDISGILLENIEAYDKIENNNIKPYSLYMATMSTAVQVSVSILKESLYELLTDD